MTNDTGRDIRTRLCDWTARAERAGDSQGPFDTKGLTEILQECEKLLAAAHLVLDMVDTNNRVAEGEKRKAWSGSFVKQEVRRVLRAIASAHA